MGPVVCREAAWRAFGARDVPANAMTQADKAALMEAVDAVKDAFAAGGTPTMACVEGLSLIHI